MANALDSLLHEHRLIEQLVLALGRFVEHLPRSNEEAARRDLNALAHAFETFVDGHHHEKEEAVLLPLSVRGGLSWEEGPVADVRREHRHERYLIEELRGSVSQATDWSAEDRRHIARTAGAIADFERTHLALENTVLFPAVLHQLSAAQLAELQASLGAFDAAAAELARMKAAVAELAERLGGRPAPAASAAHAD